MQNQSSRRFGKAAVAALLSAGLITAGSGIVLAPATYAAAPAADMNAPADGTSVTGKKPGLVRGQGELTALNRDVAPGGVLWVNGTDFKPRTETDSPFLGVKLNDKGGFVWPADQSAGNATVDESDDQTLIFSEGLDKSEWTAKVVLPSNLQEGWYWLRFLGGSDGSDVLTKIVWFYVDPSAKPYDPNAGEETAKASLTTDSATAAADGSGTITAAASGFKADSDLSVTVDGKAAAFRAGRSSAPTAKADSTGAWSGTIAVPAEAKFTAGVAHTVVISDGTTEATTSVTPTATFTVTSWEANQATTVKVAGLPAGAQVTKVGTAKNNWLKDALTAGTDGTATADVTVTGEVGDEIVAEYSVNGQSFSVTYAKKIAADSSAHNVENFDIKTTTLDSGLYQSDYYAADNSIFVTRAVGRPPISQTTLYKLDADTLEVKGSITPAEASNSTPEKTSRLAVYGVGVDNTNGLVWTTNTRQNTVAVYDAKTLELVHQFEDGAAPHARDVVVDEKTGLAYVSSATNAGTPDDPKYIISIFSKTEKVGEIALPSDFGSAMSLDLDEDNQKLYTTSLGGGKAAQIDLANGNAVRVYDLPADRTESASGVAYVPETKELWIASQTSGNLLAVNTETGEVVADVDTGAGSLNVTYEPKSHTLFVSNFSGKSVAVVGALSHKLLAQLDGAGEKVNHVEADGRGNVYSVNKNNVAGDDKKTTNIVARITPKIVDEAPADPATPASSSPEAPASTSPAAPASTTSNAEAEGDNDANTEGKDGTTTTSSEAAGNAENKTTAPMATEENPKLAATGSNALPILGLGAAAVLIGGLVLAARRRQS